VITITGTSDHDQRNTHLGAPIAFSWRLRGVKRVLTSLQLSNEEIHSTLDGTLIHPVTNDG